MAINLTEKDYEVILGDCYVPMDSKDKEVYITAIEKFISKFPTFHLKITAPMSLPHNHWAKNICLTNNLSLIDNYSFYLKDPTLEYDFNKRSEGKCMAIGIKDNGDKVVILKRTYWGSGQFLNIRLGYTCLRTLYKCFVRDILDPSFYDRRRKSWEDFVEMMNNSKCFFRCKKTSMWPINKISSLRLSEHGMWLHGQYSSISSANGNTKLVTNKHTINSRSFTDIFSWMNKLQKSSIHSQEEVNKWIDDFYQKLQEDLLKSQSIFLEKFHTEICK